ncbi:MAG TPA: hypothetical protein VGR66_00790 [Candidatus Eisenbacteria bacterium]|nr:hypothetical protein [Candidatus Eisenbacteria bacterium]
MRALVVLMALAAASSVQASPSPYVWRREILLGANQQEHFYLVESMTNAGTYYDSVESLSVYQRSNADARWVQRTTLRVTLRTTDAKTGERKDTEAFVADLGLAPYLSEHDVRPAFFEALPESVAIDAGGMYYHRRGQKGYFMSAAELNAWVTLDLPQLDARGQDRRIVSVMQADGSDSTHLEFFVVRSGGGTDDGGEIEAIVPVSGDAVDRAMNAVNAKLATRKRPATKR